MEVDTDDDLLESTTLNSEARSKGPPPDITNIPNQKYAHNNNSNSNSTNLSSSLIAKMHRNSENRPLLTGSGNLSDDQQNYSDFVHLSCNHFDNDPEFNDIVKQVEFAIDHNILPQRIYEGSSGSYFAKNPSYVKI